MYEYSAWLLPNSPEPDGIYDGDTMHVGVDLGMEVAIHATIRLYGVNAPELPTEEGKASKAWVQQWFNTHGAWVGSSFTLQTVKDKKEKYGRYLGTIVATDGANLNADIVAAGHAVVYFPK